VPGAGRFGTPAALEIGYAAHGPQYCLARTMHVSIVRQRNGLVFALEAHDPSK